MHYWLGAGTITASLVTAVYAIVTTEPGHWASFQTLLLLGIAALLQAQPWVAFAAAALALLFLRGTPAAKEVPVG